MHMSSLMTQIITLDKMVLESGVLEILVIGSSLFTYFLVYIETDF